MNGYTRTELSTALSTVIIEFEDDGFFSIIGKVPDWFARLYPTVAMGKNGLGLGEKSPSLESFLINAKSFWLKPDAEWLRSEPWSEIDRSGNECQLQAMAVCLRNKKILLIENMCSKRKSPSNAQSFWVPVLIATEEIAQNQPQNLAD